MSFGVAILGFAILIFVHEAGHFVAARAVGMRPRRFYLGFPPAIAKVERGGVEYGIGAIPLGGYVKLQGMHRPAAGDLAASLPPAQAAELAEPLAALDGALERGDDSAGLAALDRLQPSLPKNRLIEEIRDGLLPDAYWRQRAWKRVVVIAAGPISNVVLAAVLFTVVFSGATTYKPTDRVGGLLSGYPAARAGLRSGDVIVRIGGRAVAPEGIVAAVQASGGKPVTVVVDRHGHQLTLGPIKPRYDASEGRYLLGFEIAAQSEPGESLSHSLVSSFKLVGSITWGTLQAIGQLAHGQGTRNVSSVVGMVRDTAQAYRVSVWDFGEIVGAISLVLGLANLLPLLPFDGGHIVMSVLEGVRRRAFTQLFYIRYSAVGLTIFAVLLYLGLRNDTGL